MSKKINPTHVDIPFEPISSKGHNIAHAQIEVYVEGPQKVDAIIKQGPNKPILSFTTNTPGKYTVNLKHQGQHIRLSPFDVNVSAKESKDEPTAPPPSLPHIPKNHVEFEVDALDEEGNPIPESASLDISLEGPDEHAIPEMERDGEKIIISFHTTVSEGSFDVNVKYNGEHIQRSPFSVEITPQSGSKFEQRNYDIEKKRNGVIQLEPPTLHREIQFSVPARNRDGTYPKAQECKGVVILGEDSEVDVNISNDNAQPNSFVVTFNAFKQGKHKIKITHNQKGEIANSPFSINIPPEAFSKKK